MLVVRESGDTRRLGDTSQPKVITNLVELIDEFRLTYRITHANTRQTVGFGKGAKPKDTSVRRIDRRENVLGCEFSISLVKHQQRSFRCLLNHCFDCGRRPPGAHGIIRIRKINQFGVMQSRRLNQCCGIFVVVPVRHCNELSAKAGNVKVKCGVRPGRSDNLIARANKEPHQITEKAINPFTYHNVFRTNTVMVG